jgi:hypothetical protein
VGGESVKDGIYHGLTFEQYKAIEAINRSGLEWFDYSPAHYYANNLSAQRVERKETPALILGHAIHTIVLEPKEFENRYIMAPAEAPRKPDSRQRNAKKPSADTIDAIKWWDEFNAMASTRKILGEEDWYIVHRIAEQLHKKASAKELFSDGKFEVTLVWTCPLTGEKCKARIDWLTSGAIIDLKSTICAEPSQWWKQVRDYGLHCQNAWYVDGWKVLTGEDVVFVFAAVEKEEPYESGFYTAKERVVDLGRKINIRHLKRYSEAKKAKKWDGYPDEIKEFDFPDYLFKDEESQPILEF